MCSPAWCEALEGHRRGVRVLVGFVQASVYKFDEIVNFTDFLSNVLPGFGAKRLESIGVALSFPPRRGVEALFEENDSVAKAISSSQGSGGTGGQPGLRGSFALLLSGEWRRCSWRTTAWQRMFSSYRGVEAQNLVDGNVYKFYEIM